MRFESNTVAEIETVLLSRLSSTAILTAEVQANEWDDSKIKAMTARVERGRVSALELEFGALFNSICVVLVEDQITSSQLTVSGTRPHSVRDV